MLARANSLVGKGLDVAVSHALGIDPTDFKNGYSVGGYHFTTDWGLSGPIFDRENITVGPHTTSPAIAHYGPSDKDVHAQFENRSIGATKLVAGLRCFLARKLGEEFEIDLTLYKVGD